MGEFELIERYFRSGPGNSPEAAAARGAGVVLGIGDDAAVLELPAGRQLVAALDTLVEGRHFPVGCAPQSIGHRALAVNLSDLAAMGADPRWFLLALTLPAAEPDFLEAFSQGLFALAREHAISLVGGDTTAGPLAMSVQVLGSVPAGEAITRSGGRAGDLLFVSGTPGDAAAGLRHLMQARPAEGADAELPDPHLQQLVGRFLYPEPRVALGRALRGVASACIDVSDGLAADAGRLAGASGCGAWIDAAQLPLSPAMQARHDVEAATQFALGGGDDYELCFTVPPSKRGELDARLANVKCRVTCIGRLVEKLSLQITRDGNPVDCDTRGYDHFSSAG
jgi:thiamine-monophosphate kinase